MYSTLDNAVWDHFRIKTGGRSTILDAGGAEDGMIFRVNAGQNGDVGTVTYNTVLTLKNDLTATFAGAVSGSSFTSTSDMRLKENITPISNELLANLTKLNAYSYRYRREANGPTYYGVIAQEVASLFPHAVRTNAEGLMSVDYGALGAIAASAVGRVQVKVDQLQAEQQKAVVRLDKLESGLNTATLKIESLETWRIASTQKLDDIQKSLDSSMATIAKHALRLDEGEKKLVKLEEVVKDLDLKTQGQEKRLAQVEGQVKDSLSYNADSRTLQVKADFLVASNFSAQQVAAKAVMTERLEAEIARIRTLEVEQLTAKSVQATTVNSGSAQVYAGAGNPAVLFSATSDGHYQVNTSALDGSYATATVIVNAGQAKVVSQAKEGIELYAEGNVVKAVAAGKSIKASWIKTG